jgi:ribosomal subunit interface protein
MNVSVTFRQMDPSDALREYASRKLEHTVRKYIHAPIDAQATFHIEKFWHIATFNLQVRGIAIKTQEKSEDMYASVDLAMDKLERQLRRYKDKLRDHKPTKNVAGKRFEEQIIEPAPDAFVEEQEAAEAGPPSSPPRASSGWWRWWSISTPPPTATSTRRWSAARSMTRGPWGLARRSCSWTSRRSPF